MTYLNVVGHATRFMFNIDLDRLVSRRTRSNPVPGDVFTAYKAPETHAEGLLAFYVSPNWPRFVLTDWPCMSFESWKEAQLNSVMVCTELCTVHMYTCRVMEVPGVSGEGLSFDDACC